MNVLITGGAGFIGSHLADAYASKSRVTVLDSLSGGRRANIGQGVRLVVGDVTEPESLYGLTDTPQLIFHLAAQVDVCTSVRYPAEDMRVNVGGTVSVLEYARRVGARVIFASSGGAAYGDAGIVPTPETAPLAPESPYGVSKLAAEQYIGYYNRMYGTAHTILRMANVYGPRQGCGGEGGVAAIFCRKAVAGQPAVIYGDGSQTRDFVWVGDVVRAFRCADMTAVPGIWNIGTGTETSVNQLAALINVKVGHAAARDGEVSRSALDSSLAGKQLGWEPLTDISTGVAALLAYETAHL